MLKRLRDHLEKLEHFLAIAKTGSYRKAAKRLHISQPTLSYSVRILEAVCGEQLLIRTTEGSKVTPAGRTLEEFCDRYFQELDDLEQRLHAPSGAAAGWIRVGTSESLLLHLWPAFTGHLSRRYPRIALDFSTGSSTQVLSRLIDFEIDIGVAREVPAAPNVQYTELFRDTFGFFISSNSNYFTDDQGEVRDDFDFINLNIPIIYVPQAMSCDGISLIEYLSQAGLSGHSKRYEMDSLEAVRKFAEEGLGLAILPKKLVRPQVNDRTLTRVPVAHFGIKGFGEHRVMAITRANENPKAILTTVLEELSNEAEHFQR